MNPIFEKQLSESRELNQIVKQCVATKNYTKLDGYLEKLKAADPYLNPSNSTQSGMKYYMPFHFAAFDKVKNSYIAALENNTLPAISIKFEEIDHYRKELKFESYGSPQDVLYGFTSERYKNWGESLTKLFFQSASMTGVGEMLVTTAPRYLKFEIPNIEIDEIEGAIPFDFILRFFDLSMVIRDYDASAYARNYWWWFLKRFNPKHPSHFFNKMPPADSSTPTGGSGVDNRQVLHVQASQE